MVAVGSSGGLSERRYSIYILNYGIKKRNRDWGIQFEIQSNNCICLEGPGRGLQYICTGVLGGGKYRVTLHWGGFPNLYPFIGADFQIYTPSLGRISKFILLHWGEFQNVYPFIGRISKFIPLHWGKFQNVYPFIVAGTKLCTGVVMGMWPNCMPSLGRDRKLQPFTGANSYICTPSLGQTQIFAPLHWGKIAKNRPFSAEHPRTPVDKKSPPRATSVSPSGIAVPTIYFCPLIDLLKIDI